MPTISGTTTEDQTLTANTGGISDADGLGTFSYQWQRSTDGGSTWANIGTDSTTYTLGDADVGNVVRVQVSYTDAQGTAEGPLSSVQSAVIANVNDAPVGVPAISGTTTEDQTLTADTSAIWPDSSPADSRALSMPNGTATAAEITPATSAASARTPRMRQKWLRANTNDRWIASGTDACSSTIATGANVSMMTR